MQLTDNLKYIEKKGVIRLYEIKSYCHFGKVRIVFKKEVGNALVLQNMLKVLKRCEGDGDCKLALFLYQ
jgi:hypothetical protein